MSDVTKTDLVTLSRFTLAAEPEEASGDLTLLLVSIQLGCKFVASSVRKTSLVNLTGLAGTGSNIQGETQKKLDVLANDIFINSLRSSGRVCMMISEENERPIVVEEHKDARYVVAFDPLDGSSNVDAGVNTGTIFGVFRRCGKGDGSEGVEELVECTKRAENMVVAGYCMYGPSTELVMTTGGAVNGYTLDPTIGEFILTRPDIRIPRRGHIYSINEGNTSRWPPHLLSYINTLKSSGTHTARYIGSMVADIHRTLLYGGIFAYPGDRKSPKGKLRVLYECFPMALIVEKAGGKASTGVGRVLDVRPNGIHDRAPVFLGSWDDVAEVEGYYEKATDQA